MSQPTSLPSFENHGHGLLNANTGEGPQHNNNSSGVQYNVGGPQTVLHIHAGDNPSLQGEEAQRKIDSAEILRSLAFPRMFDRRDKIEPRHRNTCRWILDLEEYRYWESHSRGLLWIKGKPGAGKSTIMTFLHDELRSTHDASQGIRLDFFFTARDTDMQRTPLGMFRSLLNQIFHRDATIRPQIRDVYTQRRAQFGYSKREWEWSRWVLEELLADAILASGTHQRVTIFVDALDEAGAEFAQQLAAYFHRLKDRTQEAKVNVRICISCRHYPIVDNHRAVVINVDDHNHEDIAAYIKDHLSADTVAWDAPDLQTWKRLVNELIRQASGLFQWARIIIPLIKRKALEGESPEEIHRWLSHVPSDLEDMYMYTLKYVIERGNRAQSFLFFQWVCLAERPLTVTEMRYALVAKNAEVTLYPRQWEQIDGFVETDERMKQKIKALSGGLAEVAPNRYGNRTVQVVHQSVNDFLREKGLAILGELIGASASPIGNEKILLRCQATLYRSCLASLATAGLSQAKLNSLLSSRRQYLFKNRPFIAYATVNLFVHAEKAGESRAHELPNEIHILQRLIGLWIDLYQAQGFDFRLPAYTTLLHIAAAANLVDIIKDLASKNTNITDVNGDGNSALHIAAIQGHITVAEILRQNGANLEVRNRNGKTPLAEAVGYGQVEFVEWLLNNGANINAPIGETGGALEAASLGGREDIVRVLLHAGADVNAQSGNYGSPLQAALHRGNTNVATMLLLAGANVNAQGGHYGNALQVASLRGQEDLLMILLEAGANINAQGGYYGNALQAASHRGNTNVAMILLLTGANVNAQGGYYGNALQAAALTGQEDLVMILLEAGANINAQGGYYGNALQAASHQGNANVATMLLLAGANVNAQGGDYGNALQAASHWGNTNVARILLLAGANVNAQDSHYGNALQVASLTGEGDLVMILLEAGANVNAQGGYYGNALQAASHRGNTNVARILLLAGADVNAQGGYYGNALQAAALRGQEDLFMILLEAGANINAQGGEDRDAPISSVISRLRGYSADFARWRGRYYSV